MFNSINKGKELIENYKIYTKNTCNELKKLAENTFEVINGEKSIFIKNNIVEELNYLRACIEPESIRSKTLNIKFYKNLNLQKKYINLDNIKQIFELNENSNFRILIYTNTDDDYDSDVFIINENKQFTILDSNYASVRHKISKECLLYVLERILFFLDNNC